MCAASGCALERSIDADAVVVTCDATTPVCPSGLQCAVEIGRCLSPESPCVVPDGDALAVLEASVPCRLTGVASAVCLEGVCVPVRCGDGRVDGAAGETCDDGDGNRATWGLEPACSSTCDGVAPSCGDGVLAEQEVCDDGFRDGCGTCNDRCSGPGVGAACGDGFVCRELEACDTGGQTSSCNADCTATRCGDGIVNSLAGEACDDGGANSDSYAFAAHCNSTCTGVGPSCGDNVRSDGEECDTGGPSSTCEATCVAPRCGDGAANVAAGEACDDAFASRTCNDACRVRAVVDVGATHTCVIDDNGDVRCFGDNAFGQCGAANPAVVGDLLSTMGGNLEPLTLPAPAIAVAVASGVSCVALDTGPVHCFGDNTRGTAGAGAPAVNVGGDVVQLAAGESHMCALRRDGSVVCWGDNQSCQLGAQHARDAVGRTAEEMSTLAPVALPTPAVDLFAGDAFTCALLVDGRLACWGNNTFGQLGLGDANPRGCTDDVLQTVELVAPVTSVSAGQRSVCAALTTGAVVCWGNNEDGALGQGRAADLRRGDEPLEMGVFMPTTTVGDTDVAHLARRGGRHHCALLRDETVKCWGANDVGQLGVGDDLARGIRAAEMGEALPRVEIDEALLTVSAGPTRTCVVRIDGALVCWGDGGAGLGQAALEPLGDEPGELQAVALDARCGNGIREDGEVCDDGFNDPCGSCDATCTDTGSGAVCGDGSICAELEQCEPSLSLAGTCLDDVCTVCVGGGCTAQCAADVCGDGQVCEGEEICDPTSPILQGSGRCVASCGALVAELAVGASGACALGADGRVRCFGDAGRGRLGVARREALGASPGDLLVLEAVPLGSARRAQHVVASALGDFTCAVLSDRRVKCWGDNRSSQLGTGDRASRGITIDEMGDALPAIDFGSTFEVAQIVLGAAHVCARSTQGLFRCFGSNSHGQLGQGVGPIVGDVPDELADALPLQTYGGLTTAIAAGARHTCAIAGGTVTCWGDNTSNQVRSNGAAGVVSPTAIRLTTNSTGNVARVALGLRAGANTTCAIVEPLAAPDSELVCWGGNTSGMLGIGTPAPTLVTSLVHAAVDFGGHVALDACIGEAFACAVLDDGAVRCWGDGRSGQLGRLDLDDFDVGDEPGEVASQANVPLVAAAETVTCGARAACAQLIDGRFSCWGDNANGALGLEVDTAVVASSAGEPLPTLPLPEFAP